MGCFVLEKRELYRKRLLLGCPHDWINTNMEGGKHLLSITSRRGTPMHLLRLGASQTHVQKDTRLAQSTRCSFPAWKVGPGHQHRFL